MQNNPILFSPNFIILVIILVLLVGVVIYGFYKWQRKHNPPPHSLTIQNIPSQISSPVTPLTSLPTITSITQPEDESLKPVKLYLGDESHPWGEIVRYQRVEIDQYEEIHLSEKTSIGLSSWFQHAPSLVENSAQMMANTYKLTFAPEITKGLADGSLHLSKSLEGGVRAIAGDGNRFQGHGSLHSVTDLKLAAGIVAAWQVLAVITAQKFLVDIDKHLVKISKGIEDIKDFLEHQQYAALVGNLKYLNSIRNTLNQQQFDNTEVSVFLNQLEEIDRECLKIMVALQLQMEKTQRDFISQPLSAYLSAQEYLLASEKLVENFERQARNFLVAASIKGLAAQTRCALPSRRTLAIERLDALQNELSAWDEKQQEFYQLIEKRSPELKDWFDSERKKQERLKSKMKTSYESLNQTGKQVQELVLQTTRVVQSQLQDDMQSVSLIVELNKEDHQITKTWKLHKGD